MSKDVKENHVDDFEDLFEDEFLETEQTATAEKQAEDGTAPDEGTSAVKSKSDLIFGIEKKQLITYAVGGAIFFGLAYLVYNKFSTKVVHVKSHKVGPTYSIASRRAPVYHRVEPNKPKQKAVAKPVAKKVDSGFIMDKKALKNMVDGFTKSTSVIAKNQQQLNGRLDNIQNSVYKTTKEAQKETQKEFLRMNQQLNVLAKQQSDLALKQQKQQVAEASTIGSVVSKSSNAVKSNSTTLNKNNKILADQSKKINKLVDEMSKVSSNVMKINKSMTTLKQSMIKTQVELKLVIAQKAADMQKLTLRAVVPGRAWLVNGKGQTVTVSVGTDMPYYGKVLKIDNKANTVTMSTGYIFS